MSANLSGPLPHRIVLDPFPRSQHRSSLLKPIHSVSPVPTKPFKKWNFQKARWNQFTDFVESEIRCLPSPSKSNLNTAYSAFCLLLNKAAKRSIFRGRRQNCITAWDKQCDTLNARFTKLHCSSAEAENRASELIQYTVCLDKKRNQQWEKLFKTLILHTLAGKHGKCLVDYQVASLAGQCGRR